MRVAIIGSRSLYLKNLERYLPLQVTEIVSGGAKGIDFCTREYAKEKGLLYTEFLPNYPKYQRAAPLKRNEEIAEYADYVIAFWDGKSKGTKYTIDYCRKIGKGVSVILQEI